MRAIASSDALRPVGIDHAAPTSECPIPSLLYAPLSVSAVSGSGLAALDVGFDRGVGPSGFGVV